MFSKSLVFVHDLVAFSGYFWTTCLVRAIPAIVVAIAHVTQAHASVVRATIIVDPATRSISRVATDFVATIATIVDLVTNSTGFNTPVLEATK